MPDIAVTFAWPESLPLPFIDYSGGADVATLFSPPDAAVIKRRSRQAQTYATVAVTWKFTALQWVEFLEFWEDDLGCGSAAFTMELRYPKISGLDTWLVKIVGDLSVDDIEHTIYDVSASMQIISLAAVGAKAEQTSEDLYRLLDDTMFRRKLDGTPYFRKLE